MILSFKNKGLQLFSERGDASKLSVQNRDRVRRILQRLDKAITPEEMDVPGYFFHSLIGDKKGRYSVRMSGNWRITFAFEGKNALLVDLEDYHG